MTIPGVYLGHVANMASSLSTATICSTLANGVYRDNTTIPGNVSATGQGVFAAVGNALLVIMKVIPSALVWLAAFATFTLPAWLFTGLSTSLTFTVNMTTL